MRLTPHERAVRYRRLALAEKDPAKVKVLRMVADESDKGILFTAAWMTAADYTREEPRLDLDSKTAV